MKKITFILLFLLGLFLSVQLVVAQVSYQSVAGPGLGWHNDWWNPETKQIQIVPYNSAK